MRHWKYIVIVFLLCAGCRQEKPKEITLLQFNIWQEGTMIEGGFASIVNHIARLQPDFVTFSEVRNYNDTDFIARLINALSEADVTYYGERSVSTGIISRYPILKQEVVYPLQNDRGSVLKASFLVEGREVVVYSAHLDWLNCSSYLPRGYGSSDWKKLPLPITEIDSLLADNRASFRDDEIRALLSDAQKEQDKVVLIGGDFNEPSHLDWQADTKNIRDHHDVVIEWDCSALLYSNGFVDAFREKYPDAVDYPGFTFAADNPAAKLDQLVWSPDADDRERIDFIYYRSDHTIALKDIRIVGPSGSILRGERAPDSGKDTFIEPIDVWPTDHKALLATFILLPEGYSQTVK
ncbi:endonuclease/exonuclease/phosphatase family protein [Tannerella sp.]|uniref:endonuclease/exonuclease/phosphatase family protein n=1 Tax=Tannerella sp. TaxID=2382127 RepID=UPI0026DB3849|nr:endonuclease/exonuclease/phosphatase family protein [Tannerella sp.]MDO4703843.1 endonuclease/exonuclease/phosphatase family protein [Tannerella sp.]